MDLIYVANKNYGLKYKFTCKKKIYKFTLVPKYRDCAILVLYIYFF